jgi:hypothetical protein
LSRCFSHQALNRAGGRLSRGTVAGDLPIASLGRDALTRPPPSPRGGSLPWVSGAAASSSWVSCRCRSARRGGEVNAASGIEGVRRETPARRKTHTKIGSTTGGRGSRDARFACRPRVARAGTTVTATSRKRLRSRAGLLDALPPRTSCSMCPMSSSMSDCFSSGWNASPLGPRARAIGAHDPSSFHRAIGLR